MDEKLPKVTIEHYLIEQGWVKRRIYVDGVLIPSENIEYIGKSYPLIASNLLDIGSVVEIPFNDNLNRSAIVTEIKDNKAILFSGDEIDIDDLKIVFRYPWYKAKP